MKILAFERDYGDWTEAMAQALACDSVPAEAPVASAVITDSATLRPHEPLFVPDFARGWILMVQPALTVNRLGKWIAPRFARRYMGDFRLCARLMPPAGRSAAGALETSFDGALAWGYPRPAADVFDRELTVTASLDDGSPAMEVTLRWEDLRLEESVALASRYMTLKTGDVILPCRTPLCFPAIAGTRLSASYGLSAEPDLNLKIK